MPLETWYKGFIPKTTKIPITSQYHRELAKIGYTVAKSYFDIDLYYTQSLIVGAILAPQITEVGIITPTRYGKTFCFGIGAQIAASIMHLEVQIGGGDKEKAKIAMKKIQKLLQQADSRIKGTLIGDDKIERLATSVSKTVLAWSDKGSIDIFSLSDRIQNTDVAGQGAVGIGGDLIMLDESDLVGNESYSVARRMLSEKEHTKLVEISNPQRAKSHFFNTMHDGKVFRIWIDEETMIEEGRISREKLERAKTGMTTKEIKKYFKCEFPSENEFTYFKPTRWELMPHNLKYYGACDPALGESGKSGSLAAIVILGVDQDGRVYEIESIGEILTPDQIMNKIVSFPYRFERFGVEAIQFQRYFFHEIEKKSRELKIYMPLTPLTQERKKEERVESLEPYISTGQILFRGDNELWEEMQNYPKSDKLDVLDTLEMAWRLAKGGGTGEVTAGDDIINSEDF